MHEQEKKNYASNYASCKTLPASIKEKDARASTNIRLHIFPSKHSPPSPPPPFRSYTHYNHTLIGFGTPIHSSVQPQASVNALLLCFL